MKIRTFFGLTALLGLIAVDGYAESLPLRAFARLPAFDSVTVSPDGRYLAMIRPDEGMRMAYVVDLKENGTIKRVMGGIREGNFSMTWCRWGNKTRLLCAYRAMKPDGKNIYPTTRLAAVNVDGSDFKFLVQNVDDVVFSQLHDRVIDWSPATANTILLELDADRNRLPAVFELDIYSGRLTEVVHQHEPIRRFISDNHGTIRLGEGFQADELSYLARLAGENTWTELGSSAVFDEAPPLRPLAMNGSENKVYARGLYEGRDALWELDLAKPASPTLLFSHPEADVGEPIFTSHGQMLGISYETDHPFAYYTDKESQLVVDTLKPVLPSGSFISIVDISADRQQYVVATASDVDGGTYYLLNPSDSKLARLGSTYPELAEQQDKLGRMRSIRYPASDGTQIPGYLTVPAGQRAEKLPLIVMPHGGPLSRDSWSFNWLAQFLVNRGYAVLQMNYRGSSGYGDKWFRAAHQDWGGLTQSDIADGARWAIREGIADPERLCIVGWGFGGYSALLGAARNGDLYKCAVSVAGMTDLIKLQEDVRDLDDVSRGRGGTMSVRRDENTFINQQILRAQTGTDKEKLKTSSPLRLAEEIAIPVLMVHGDMDAQIRVDHSREMAKALKRAKKSVKLVEIENADHQMSRESDRVTLLSELETFLDSQIGVASARNN